MVSIYTSVDVCTSKEDGTSIDKVTSFTVYTEDTVLIARKCTYLISSSTYSTSSSSKSDFFSMVSRKSSISIRYK